MHQRGMVYLFFGADFTDFTVLVVSLTIQVFELLVHTILRKGKDFAFYLDALSEVYQ